MNPFAMFILKEANGFVTAIELLFLTPKFTRPGIALHLLRNTGYNKGW